jgi:NitT/TauT family transport system ATP-binding protein
MTDARPPTPPAGAAAAPILTLDGVGHAYGPTPILAGIDLTLAAGDIACLIGPSGVGKSTLLAVAGGLVAPSAGRVERRFVRPGWVFQDPARLPWRTARANAAFALKAAGAGRAERRAAAAAMLARFGLDDADQRKYPHALSGGMRRRVALARALVIAPDMLLMDEPFTGLDPGRARQLQALVAGEIAARGLTALIVTHDLAEAVRLADRVLVLGRPPGATAAALVADIRPAGPRAGRDEARVAAEVARLLADPAVAAALAVPDPA